jgi:hypothetical protein
MTSIPLAVLLLAAVAACAPTASSPEPASRALVVAPDGAGSTCTAERPCSLDRALDAAKADETISLLDGEYGDLAPTADAFSSARTNVVIEAADGATPTIGKLDLNIPGTTWSGLTFTGGIYLDDGADRTKLDDIHVSGSGVFVHADGVTISDALIENGTSIDGLQIGGAEGLLVENSTIRGFGQSADSDVHSDCVQLFDSSKIVLRGNYLGGCDNAALIFSPGGGTGIDDVTVEGNFVQGCVEKTERCSQGTALDLREATAVDVVVRNNTILDGSVMVDALDGLVFDRNIVGYASNCDMPMTNSIVVDWNRGKCDRPKALGVDGNREGTVEVVDRAHGDLRLVNPEQAAIDPSGDSKPARKGYDGATLESDTAGAGG